MIIDDIEYVQKKIFFRIVIDSMDIVYSEVLDPEAGLPEEISQSTALEGIAEIEGHSLDVIKDNKQFNSFKKILFQIVESENIELPLEVDKSKGYLLYSNSEYLSMEQPTVRVYAPKETLNSIKSEIITDDTKMEIGIYANLYVMKSMSKFEADDMLEKLFIFDETHKAVLANFAIRRTVKSINEDNDVSHEEEYNVEISIQELKEEVKNIHQLIDTQHTAKISILNHFSLLNLILVGWSAFIVFIMFNK